MIIVVYLNNGEDIFFAIFLALSLLYCLFHSPFFDNDERATKSFSCKTILITVL